MVRLTDIQTQVGADLAAQPAHITGMTGVLEVGKDTTHELVIAKTLTNVSRTGVLNAALVRDLRGTIYESDVNNALRHTTTKAWLLPGLNNLLTTFHSRLLVDPLTTRELRNINNEINTFVLTRRDIIRNDQGLILMLANLRHTIAQKSIEEPNNPTGISPLDGHTVTSSPLNITWLKAHANNTIELIDSTGTVLASDTGAAARAFTLNDIRGLSNGRQNLILRTKNSTTNVSHDTPYVLNINLPTTPDTPDNLSKEITAEPWRRWRISGKLKTASHTIRIVDNTHTDITALCAMVRNPNGSFYVDLPLAPIGGPHIYELLVGNGATPPQEHSEEIRLNVANPIAPTIAPVSIATPARIRNTNVAMGEHHVHIDLTNPVPGSEVTITGDWLPNPVTINIPNPITQLPAAMRHGRSIHITLPGFDAHTAWIKNMIIKTTDAHNASNTLETKFTILVEEDPHHVPDNRKLSEAAFLVATRAVPRVYTLQNDHPAGRTYDIGRGPGWWSAEVPVLPGEERFRDWPTRLRSTSRRGLAAKVQTYLKDLNARAAVMNHGDHDDHGEHPETPATPATHTAPSWNDAHAAAAGGHTEGHASEAKWGKFVGVVKAVWKTAAWPVGGALAGLGYAAWAGGAVLLGPAVVGGAVAGASIWAIRRLWRIKNPKKWGGEEKAHH